MYRKIITVLFIGIFTLSTFVLNAQTETSVEPTREGEIVMTKSQLISFLEKIAEAKKKKMQQDLENSELQYPRSSYSISPAYATPAPVAPITSHIPVTSMSRNELLREIDALHARMNAMSGYGTGGGSGGSTTFLTTPGGGQGGYYYPYPTQTQTQTPFVSGVPTAVPDPNIGELRWKIDSLQRQVSLLSEPSTFVEKKDEILRLNKQIDQVQDSLIASVALTPEAKEIVKRYGTSEMKVYFDNDVSEVSPRFRSEVEDAATVLKKNPQLGVVLKGFASPVGNAKYNYDLSMRRNESVKRMLIDLGVFPDQISSVFYGEDKSTSEAEARRVEIKFIIK